ncbi:putative membrane protein YphA (DoxX/SURF4 family) [Kitasatospora herbaricolor]|uniref:MauE/DoxX family redox-associated membrane protein n=1 Tax=Kitasatospora herbaricolor TaxID=68217 RepID=UPI00174940EE|nr:MauE/DoxX family redox-associated membrane protein [Kitasatospora herbaricolor]MDQ0307737.1 putative membrane protein YphA (DoxX/SURF4 family) [Kitasatospora herbaricolor]
MAGQQDAPSHPHTATRPVGGALRRVADGPAGEWIGTVVRLALAVVWGWAGLAKISDPAEAAQAVRAYEILPESLVKPVGYALPFLEVALAVLLLIGLGVRVVAVVSALLLLTFIAGITSAWVRGISIDCGCFGGGGTVDASQTEYLQEILRDTGFLLLAAWLVYRPRTRLSADAWLAA